MKVRRQDLDSSILDKLDQFDNIINTYNENSDGFISYNERGFYFKKTNDTFLKKVFDEEDLVKLENSLTSTDRNIKSSLLEDLRCDDKTNFASRRFLYNIKTVNKKDYDSEIVLVSKYLVLTKSGNLYKGDSSFNICSKLVESFNIPNYFYVLDIVDIIDIDENNFIIATNNYGIFKLIFSEKQIEMIINLKNVKKICLAQTGALIVASDDFISLVDISTGMFIEKYYTLKNANQLPVNIILNDRGFFVIGTPIGIQLSGNLIHFWELDAAKVGYNLKDGLVSKHSIDNSYQILFSMENEGNIYLAGKINNKYCFVWKYNFEDLTLSEEIFDCKEILSFDCFLEMNGFYMIGSKDRLYVMKNNSIVENLKLEAPMKNIYINEGYFYGICGKSIISFTLPNFEKKIDNLSYKVYNSDEACNNIDIFVKNSSRAERITILNADTNREIEPSYYMVYKSNSVIKLMNCQAKNIKMVISVNENSDLHGIVIRTNRMFLR